MLGTPEALRQCVEGEDFIPLSVLLNDLTPEQATAIPLGCPYSIAGVVGHMLFWQERWLSIIDELPVEAKRGKNGDWPRIDAASWMQVRGDFLRGETSALRKAQNQSELLRKTKSGKVVERFLLQMGIHNTYHAGQIVLMRQLLGCWPPAGTNDHW